MSNKPQKTVAPVDIENETTALVETQPGTTELAPTQSMAIGEVSGDIGGSDLKFPTLRIIQKMSENPDKLDEGLITLDNTRIVGNHKNVARFVLLSFHKYYREVLPFGAGMPKTFDRPEEAVSAGFIIARSKEDRDCGRPIVEDAARAIIAIEQPEGVTDRGFPYELGGKRYALAIWWIQSSAYAAVAKYIISKRAFELRGTNLLKSIWTLSADKKSGPRGDYYVPAVKLLDAENSDEFIADVATNVKL